MGAGKSPGADGAPLEIILYDIHGEPVDFFFVRGWRPSLSQRQRSDGNGAHPNGEEAGTGQRKKKSGCNFMRWFLFCSVELFRFSYESIYLIKIFFFDHKF